MRKNEIEELYSSREFQKSLRPTRAAITSLIPVGAGWDEVGFHQEDLGEFQSFFSEPVQYPFENDSALGKTDADLACRQAGFFYLKIRRKYLMYLGQKEIKNE